MLILISDRSKDYKAPVIDKYPILCKKFPDDIPIYEDPFLWDNVKQYEILHNTIDLDNIQVVYLYEAGRDLAVGTGIAGLGRSIIWESERLHGLSIHIK